MGKHPSKNTRSYSKRSRAQLAPTARVGIASTARCSYSSLLREVPGVLPNYSKVYNYLDTVGRGYKPRQRGWGGAATLQNVNLFLDFTINTETSYSLWYKKNKEIKRVLSKKMAFSLMRLIIIFALAFVAPSAMAQFITTLSVEDVSYAADNQIERGADKEIERGEVMVSVTEVVVSVTFGKAVDMSTIAAEVELRTTNEFGGLIANLDADPESVEAQVVTVAHKYPHRVDGQNFTLTFLVDATARVATVKNEIPYKSVLRVAEVPAIAIGDTETSAVADITIYYVDPPVPDETGGVPNTKPRPVRIAFDDDFLVPAAGFDRDSFHIIVTLSEQPKENLFTASHLTVVNGTAESGIYLGAIAPIDGADADENVDAATGRDGMHHWYLFRITPAAIVGNLVIKLNNFEDQEKPVSNRYIAPFRDIDRVEGFDKLTVKINKPAPVRADALAGIKVSVPAGIVIPGRGYLVAARNDGGGDADTHALRTDSTQIIYPGDPTKESRFEGSEPSETGIQFD